MRCLTPSHRNRIGIIAVASLIISAVTTMTWLSCTLPTVSRNIPNNIPILEQPTVLKPCESHETRHETKSQTTSWHEMNSSIDWPEYTYDPKGDCSVEDILQSPGRCISDQRARDILADYAILHERILSLPPGHPDRRFLVCSLSGGFGNMLFAAQSCFIMGWLSNRASFFCWSHDREHLVSDYPLDDLFDHRAFDWRCNTYEKLVTKEERDTEIVLTREESLGSFAPSRDSRAATFMAGYRENDLSNIHNDTAVLVTLQHWFTALPRLVQNPAHRGQLVEAFSDPRLPGVFATTRILDNLLTKLNANILHIVNELGHKYLNGRFTWALQLRGFEPSKGAVFESMTMTDPATFDFLVDSAIHLALAEAWRCGGCRPTMVLFADSKEGRVKIKEYLADKPVDVVDIAELTGMLDTFRSNSYEAIKYSLVEMRLMASCQYIVGSELSTYSLYPMFATSRHGYLVTRDRLTYKLNAGDSADSVRFTQTMHNERAGFF